MTFLLCGLIISAAVYGASLGWHYGSLYRGLFGNDVTSWCLKVFGAAKILLVIAFKCVGRSSNTRGGMLGFPQLIFLFFLVECFVNDHCIAHAWNRFH